MKYSCPIVDTHASWLALNPIHGCPFSCKYCFMSGIGNTARKPVVLCEPEEAVKKLLSYSFYIPTMPLCLFSSTDAFATPTNVEYAKRLILELSKNGVKNPIILITKCYVPDDFIDLIDEVEGKGMKVIFLLSYSGLDSTIERGINHQNIKKNFINLNKRNKKIIHYWRPFIPQNSTNEKIEEVLAFVKKYACASIAIGLKVQDSFADCLDFWPEIVAEKKKAINSEATWTKEAYEKIYNTKYCEYKIFRSTSCAISYCLGQPDYNCYFNTKICELNNCSFEQISRCKNRCDIDKSDLNALINKYLNLKKTYKIDEVNKEIVFDDILSTGEIVGLKYLTGYNIRSDRNINDHYWNTGHYEEEHFII